VTGVANRTGFEDRELGRAVADHSRPGDLAALSLRGLARVGHHGGVTGDLGVAADEQGDLCERGVALVKDEFVLD
jgi:hypothetical protein